MIARGAAESEIAPVQAKRSERYKGFIRKRKPELVDLVMSMAGASKGIIAMATAAQRAQPAEAPSRT
jgi:hypothetical protein